MSLRCEINKSSACDKLLSLITLDSAEEAQQLRCHNLPS